MNILSASVVRTGAGHDLVRGLAAARRSRPTALEAYPSLAGADGARVALGIRPESLFDAATADPSWLRLVADVELVENLPPEKLVHLRVDAQPVVTDATVEIAQDIDAAAAEDLQSTGKGSVAHARLTGASAVREGARAEFAVPPSALHFFDLSTGQAIAPVRPRLAGTAAGATTA